MSFSSQKQQLCGGVLSGAEWALASNSLIENQFGNNVNLVVRFSILVKYKYQYVFCFCGRLHGRMIEYFCWDLALHHRSKDLVSTKGQELVDTIKQLPTYFGKFLRAVVCQ